MKLNMACAIWSIWKLLISREESDGRRSGLLRSTSSTILLYGAFLLVSGRFCEWLGVGFCAAAGEYSCF